MIAKSQLAWAVVLALACGSSTRIPPTGVLSCDVYLVMKSGDVKKGVGNTVAVVPLSDSLMQLLKKTCAAADSEQKELSRLAKVAHLAWYNAPDSKDFSIANRAFATKLEAEAAAEHYDPLNKPLAFLGSLSGHRSQTGMEAHYTADSLPPGRVLLWAETRIGNNHYLSMRVAEVTPGQTTTVDLDNSTVFDPGACTVVGYP